LAFENMNPLVYCQSSGLTEYSLTEPCIQKYVLGFRRFRLTGGVERRGVEERRMNAVASVDLDGPAAI
jgi:hypothetical protein